MGAVRRKSFASMDCSVARSLEQVGEWWTLLVIRDAFLGVTRFDEFRSRLGIAPNVLSDRLETLVSTGVLRRDLYSTRPVRHDYRLTEKGRDLFGVLVALRQWGDRWLTRDEPPVVLEHVTCGHTTTALLSCSECGREVTARNVLARGRLLPARHRRASAADHVDPGQAGGKGDDLARGELEHPGIRPVRT